jgi:hypothetical protein
MADTRRITQAVCRLEEVRSALCNARLACIDVSTALFDRLFEIEESLSVEQLVLMKKAVSVDGE